MDGLSDLWQSKQAGAIYDTVRDIGNIYENDTLMTEYSVFTPYMGDYYQITDRWTDARTA